jgi:alpha-tubulin suppressor-like RCC1 family protein
VQVAAGSRFAFAVTEDGDLYSWGDNGLGQTGHPRRVDKRTAEGIDVGLPVLLDLTSRFQKTLHGTNSRIKVLDVAAGSDHAILLVCNENKE